MSAFPNWQKFAVRQRRQTTGCIPTGYEIILRAAEIPGIDFDCFQEEFDLDKDGGKPRNNFESVALEIKGKYPFVEFKSEGFPQGQGSVKVAKIEEFMLKKRPLLVSLARKPIWGEGGWHIMLAVDSTQDELHLLQGVDGLGKAHVMRIRKADIAKIHDEFDGGKEIAYLLTPEKESPSPSP